MQGTQLSSVCDADPPSALIFVGTLTELTPDDNASWLQAKFQVTELFQGEQLNVVNAPMMTGFCGDAATSAKVGESYLVLTHLLPRGGIGQLLRCEQLRPAGEAAPELEYLRSSQSGETKTGLSGEAMVDAKENGVLKKVPLPGTKIQVTADNRTIEFVSDEDGLFRGALKPGKYAVNVQLPAGYHQTDYDLDSIITLTAHRCTQLTIHAYPTGSITAHIVGEAGEKLNERYSIQFSLETADDGQQVKSVFPDENSDLVINGLPPGEYILGVNTYMAPDPTPSCPSTYYPGVNQRSDAQVISLALGEQKVLQEIRITKAQECHLPH